MASHDSYGTASRTCMSELPDGGQMAACMTQADGMCVH